MFTLELSNHDDSGSQGTLSSAGGEFSEYCTALYVENDVKEREWAPQSVVSGGRSESSVGKTKTEAALINS